MNAFGPAPPGHGTAGVLVHNDDLATLDNIIPVHMEQGVGLECRMHMMQQVQVVGSVKTFALLKQAVADQQRFDLLMSIFSELDLALFLIHIEITAFIPFLLLFRQVGHQFVDGHVQLRGIRSRTGNDQRSARLINEDGIHLIHHRVVEATLHTVFQPEGHVVAQIVETVFVIGAIGNVAGIGIALLLRGLLGQDDANTQAQKFIQRTHPVGITLSQVIVHCHHMHAFTRQRIEVHRQGGGQGLALTGSHLGNATFVKGDPAHHLDIEVAHTHDPGGRFTHHRKGLRQQFVQRLALLEGLPEFPGLELQV